MSNATTMPNPSTLWPSGSLDFMIPDATVYPWYYVPAKNIMPWIRDRELSLFLPIISYWIYSLFFHFLDIYGAKWKWLSRYRIHESQEVKARNTVSRTHVVLAVVFQQVLQTLLGFLYLDEEDIFDRTEIGLSKDLKALSQLVANVADMLLGHRVAVRVLASSGSSIVWVLYWWAIPVVKTFFAFTVLDSWQYFVHRLFHTNQFLYRNFHSWHHRLYVPYAYGALYNHPVEGFVMDSLGTVVAHTLASMSLRQAILFFTFSSCKTVDDHCGYSLPFDPLQFLFANNADYHDIHHQSFGIKKNFSQPFFIHWDYFLGTRMTREDVKKRAKIQDKVL